MVIKNTESTLGYRCPHCGAGVLSMVGIFALSGDMIKLKCDCGRSELTVKRGKDGNMALCVPCLFCPRPHNYNVSHTAFFGQDISALACSMTGIDICYIGKKESVMGALDAQEKEILDMLKQAGYGGDVSLADLFSHDGEDGDIDTDVNFTDNHIYDMVLFVVKDLLEEGKVFCRCTEHGGEGDIDVVCDRDRIFVSCKVCGARKEILCNGSMATQAFLDADSLTLEGMYADGVTDEDDNENGNGGRTDG